MSHVSTGKLHVVCILIIHTQGTHRIIIDIACDGKFTVPLVGALATLVNVDHVANVPHPI